MKKDLYDMLQEASPGDIDLLWGGIHSEEIDEITAQRIREAAFTKVGLKNRGKAAPARRYLRRIAAAVACLMLTVGLAFGGRAYAAEVKEYKAAVAFFQENDLDVEGLTRAELKAVYRDITTESFSLNETLLVLERSLRVDQVEGYDISQAEPDPADVEALWNYKKLNIGGGDYAPYFPWAYESQYVVAYDTLEDGSLRPQIVARYENSQHIWDVTFQRLIIYGTCPLPDGVLVWGDTPEQYYEGEQLYSNGQVAGVVAKISTEGELLWQLQLDSGDLPRGGVLAAADNGDGTYAVLSKAFDTVTDEHLRFLLTVDSDGRIIRQTQAYGTEELSMVQKMVCLEGKYLLMGSVPGEASVLVRLAADGSASRINAFRQEGLCYHFTDMISDGRHVWLSAYTMASDEDDVGALTRAVRDRMAETGASEIDRIELTDMTRQYYGAVLLVLDHAESTPQIFFSLRGSIGRSLSSGDDGSLVWEVERIDSADFQGKEERSDGIDYVMCATRVFRYSFGADGDSLRREDTGLYSVFGQAQTISKGKYEQ